MFIYIVFFKYFNILKHLNFQNFQKTPFSSKINSFLKNEKMVNCKFPTCLKEAFFGLFKSTPRHCSGHKLPGEYNVVRKLCNTDGCFKLASFGILSKQPIHCGPHKHEGEFDVMNPVCIEEGCKKQPNFGLTGKKATHCDAHKIENEVNVKSKKCVFEGCNKLPSFGKFGGKKIHCTTHKEEGEVPIGRQKCITDGCDKKPSYGLVWGNPLHCSPHREENESNVRHQKCITEGCETLPSYGTEKGNAIHCVEHKEDSEVNVNSVFCTTDGCGIIASFGKKGSKKKIHCAQHTEPGELNITNKICETKGCGILANYAIPGNSKQFCVRHKKKGMIYIKNLRCIEPGCRDAAIFGIVYATHCGTHQLSTQFNLVEKKCNGCELFNIVDSDGFCYTCRPSSTKFLPAQTHLLKQRVVQGWLETRIDFPQFDFSDVQLTYFTSPTCMTGYKPDCIWDFTSHFVVLEVDEDQHRTYQEWCDCVRMKNISETLMRPMTFIRYNPDPYITDGKKLNPTMNARMERVEVWLRQLSVFASLDGAILSFIPLFYDGYRFETESLVKID
jgi:hypothetical protein